MAKTAEEPNLDLNTLTEDVPVKINGKFYGIRQPDSLSLVDYKQLETDLPRLGHLMVRAKLTKPEAEEAKRLLADVVDVILDAPEPLRKQLKDVQRVLILDRFTRLRSDVAAPTTEAPIKVRRRTGARSSRL